MWMPYQGQKFVPIKPTIFPILQYFPQLDSDPITPILKAADKHSVLAQISPEENNDDSATVHIIR